MNERTRTVVVSAGLIAGALLGGTLVARVFGDGVPKEMLLYRGIIFGSINALLAAGLVFVHRATKVVNFAQAGFGAATVLLYLNLRDAWDWSFWLAFPAALVAALVAGLLAEVFVLRRFSRSARLVMTVVTIALGQAFLGLALELPELFGFEEDPETGILPLPTTAPSTPFDSWTWTSGDVHFLGPQLAAVLLGVVALVALAAFLRFTRLGTAIRGAAENRDRASQLGIDVDGLSSVVWVIVAGLGAAAALMSLFAGSGSMESTVRLSFNAFGVGALLRGLAPAVVARMENLPIAIAGAFAVGMFEEAVRWSTGQSATVDIVLLAAVVVALLLQRRGESRVDADDASSWAATEEVRGIPHELAALPAVKRGVRRAMWIATATVALFPWVMSPSQTNTGSLYAIYGLIGISLVVLTGWGGQISLGQFGFVAIGAVTGGWLSGEAGLPFPLVVLLAPTVTAVVAVGVGLPALRIKGLFLAVSTMAFAVVAGTVVVNRRYTGFLLVDQLERPRILWIETSGERAYYYVCVAAVAFAIFTANGLRRSRTGRLLIAMRDNERAAQSFTINLVRTRLTAFAYSGFLAGLAGVLYVHHQNGLSPLSYDANRSVAMFLMAVIGGLGSVYSVLSGAVLLGVLDTLFSGRGGGSLLAASIGTLGILMFFPTGLGSLLFRARDGWLRRIAMRNRIFVASLVSGRLKEGDEAKIPIGDRPDDATDVPTRYELEGSVIGDQGKSQFTKVWRY